MFNWIVRLFRWLFGIQEEVEEVIKPEVTNHMMYEVSVEIAKQTVARSLKLFEVRRLEYNYNQVKSVLSDPRNGVIYITPLISDDIRASGMSIGDYVELHVSYEIALMSVPSLDYHLSRIHDLETKRMKLHRGKLIMECATHERNLAIYIEKQVEEIALKFLHPSLHWAFRQLIRRNIEELEDQLDYVIKRCMEMASTIQ